MEWNQSPFDELDVMLKVTMTKAWLALSFFLLVALSLISWGIWGEVTLSVEGKSIFFNAKTPYKIISIRSGVVEKVYVSSGQTVETGDLLISLLPSSVIQKIEEAEKTLQKAKTLSDQKKIQELESELRALKLHSERDEIRSRLKGEVFSLNVEPGKVIQQNEELVSIYPEDSFESANILAFVPYFYGEKIKRGMKTLTDLDSIDSARFGMLEGTVEWVSPYPVETTDPFLTKIPSTSLKTYLIEGRTPSILVVIKPKGDPKTLSKFKWTSKKGPSCQIYSGTTAISRIILKKQAPITFVIPNFKETSCGF